MGYFRRSIIFQITVPASQAANSILTGSNAQIFVDPTVGPQNSVQIAGTHTWIIRDIYITSAPGIDVMLRIKKNNIRTLVQTPPVSTMLVSNPSRQKIPAPILFGPNDQLTIEAINLAAGAASATTVTVYADVDVYTAD